jgi:hypothetical protein
VKDELCIFCRIVSGALDACHIYEDEQVSVFSGQYTYLSGALPGLSETTS